MFLCRCRVRTNIFVFVFIVLRTSKNGSVELRFAGDIFGNLYIHPTFIFIANLAHRNGIASALNDFDLSSEAFEEVGVFIQSEVFGAVARLRIG